MDKTAKIRMKAKRNGITVEAILHKLMEEYEVREEVCEKEVLAFLDKLEQAGILEEV